MPSEPSDTHPQIHKLQIEGYRRMTPAEQIRQVFELHEFAERLAMADVRRRYPDADEHELKLRAASRRLPPELLLKAFGWDVKEHGY